jgi:hypothetical protein
MQILEIETIIVALLGAVSSYILCRALARLEPEGQIIVGRKTESDPLTRTTSKTQGMRSIHDHLSSPSSHSHSCCSLNSIHIFCSFVHPLPPPIAPPLPHPNPPRTHPQTDNPHSHAHPSHKTHTTYPHPPVHSTSPPPAPPYPSGSA